MKTLLATLCATAALFSTAFADRTPPKVSLQLPASAKAGKAVQGWVVVSFANGLHGYQNPPTKDYLIPISVTSTTKGVTLKSAKYPKGKPEIVAGETSPVNVYEGTIKIPVTLMLPKQSGKVKVGMSVHYQQCNAQSCFPPGDVSASASVNVK
jgi:DsbC/DsbD-like thiol-disulfide interchange protein